MQQLDTGRVVLAVTLIAAGVIILAVRRFGGSAESLWPFFIIVPGLALAALATTGGWQSKSAATAGAVVAGIGVILLVQDVTDYYRSWAYAWTLLPAFAGAGLFIVGYRENDEATKATGRGLMQWGGIGFVVFAVAFEALIFHGRVIAGGWVLPIVLIAVGAFLLLRPPGRPRMGAGTSNDDATSSADAPGPSGTDKKGDSPSRR